jgi:CBS domain-containing protein
MRVHAAMTSEVVTVTTETPLREVARVLADRRISGLPVVDARGRLVGVVSEADIISSALGESHGGPMRALHELLRLGPLGATLREATAGRAMSTPAITIAPGRSVADAAAIMLDRGVNRLPVVDSGRLVGIVTRADLVRAFARDDERIAREIWGEVVLRGVYVSPKDVTVVVRNGEVTLTGEVETRGKAERLVEYVRRVPGVVAVESQVAWRTTGKAPRGIRA